MCIVGPCAFIGCSLIGDLSAQQCATDADCTRLGDYECVADVCVARDGCDGPDGCPTGQLCVKPSGSRPSSCVDPEDWGCMLYGDPVGSLHVGVVTRRSSPAIGGVPPAVLTTVSTAMAQIEEQRIAWEDTLPTTSVMVCDIGQRHRLAQEFRSDLWVFDVPSRSILFNEVAKEVALLLQPSDNDTRVAAAAAKVKLFEVVVGKDAALTEPFVALVEDAAARVRDEAAIAEPRVVRVVDAAWQSYDNDSLGPAVNALSDVDSLAFSIPVPSAPDDGDELDLLKLLPDIAGADPDVVVLVLEDEAFALIANLEAMKPSTTRRYVLGPSLRYAPDEELGLIRQAAIDFELSIAPRITGLEHFTDAGCYEEFEAEAQSRGASAAPVGRNILYDALFMIALAQRHADLATGLALLGADAAGPILSVGSAFGDAQAAFDSIAYAFSGTTGEVRWTPDTAAMTRAMPPFSAYGIVEGVEAYHYKFGISSWNGSSFVAPTTQCPPP